MIVTEHRALEVDIKALKHFPGNPKLGNIEVIRESLRKNGQYRPLVVRRSTMEILAGNHTWDAAQEEGWKTVWANFIDCDDETAARINLVDNRSSELGAYNQEALVAQLGKLPDLVGTGYTSKDVDKLQASLVTKVGGDTDPSEVPEEPQTRRGDLYVMGVHRLLCGDATVEHDVTALMGGEQAVCLWTDPPFLGPVDNSARGEHADPESVRNTTNSLKSLLDGAFAQASRSLIENAAIYMLIPSGPNSVIFLNCFKNQGWHIRQQLVWLKESAYSQGHHHYNMRHEPIVYGSATRKEPEWYGPQDADGVFEVERPPASVTELHPTARPITLVEKCLVNSVPRNGLIYDPFAGSGATLIAAHNVRRRAAVMELDPGYCDVIVDRWERHTGNQAVKIRAS